MAVETLQEFTDSRGIRLGVDREAGVIRGVKLLGLESTKGRTYLKEAVARAAGLYEGAKVNIDHALPGKETGPRNYADRIGIIENVRVEQGDGGLRGDFRANPKHRLWEQLAWDAEHAPQSVGFSHNVIGKTATKNGKVVVEEISRVTSVDLVADPATTRGLFEDEGDRKEGTAVSETLTMSSLREQYPGLLEEHAKEVLTEHAQSEDVKAKDAKLKEQAETIDRLEAEKALTGKRQKIDAAIQEAKMPAELATDLFRQQLSEAAGDDAIKALIDDRMEVAKASVVTPKSKEQRMTEGETHQKMDRKDFVKTLKRGRRGING